MSPPIWMAIGIWFLFPVWLFDHSMILATIFQVAALLGYAVFIVCYWRQAARLRRWIPWGYPVVVLLTNVVPIAPQLARRYFE